MPSKSRQSWLLGFVAAGMLAAATDAAQEVPQGPSTPATDAGGSVSIESVQAAYDNREWARTAKDARLLLDRAAPTTPAERAGLLLMESDAHLALRRYDVAVVTAEECARLLGRFRDVPEEWMERARLVNIHAQMALGKSREARQAMETFLSACPTRASSEAVLDMRAVLETDTGLRVDPRYSGRFEGDPRIVLIQTRLQQTLPRAVRRVQVRLGDPTPTIPPVVARLKDAREMPAESWMAAHSYNRGQGIVGVIDVRAEDALAGADGEEECLAHEILHLLQQSMSGDTSLPTWMEEGLADWACDPSEDVLWDRILSEGDLLLLSSIGRAMGAPSTWGGQEEMIQRCNGALVFRFLERSRGLDTVRRLARALLSCTGDPEKAFAETVGTTPGQVVTELGEDYDAWVHEALDGLAEVGSLETIGKTGDAERLLDAFSEFTRRHATSRLQPYVRLQAVNLLLEKRNYDSARRLLEQVRKGAPPPRALRIDFLQNEIHVALVGLRMEEARRLRKELETVTLVMEESERADLLRECDESMAQWEQWAKDKGAPR